MSGMHTLVFGNFPILFPYLHEQVVSLLVMLVRCMWISFKFVEKSCLELVPHKQVQVRRFVQKVTVTFHVANFLKKKNQSVTNPALL